MKNSLWIFLLIAWFLTPEVFSEENPSKTIKQNSLLNSPQSAKKEPPQNFKQQGSKQDSPQSSKESSLQNFKQQNSKQEPPQSFKQQSSSRNSPQSFKQQDSKQQNLSQNPPRDFLYYPFGKEAFLTSSFGENRGTRYHAGVDYSTEMKEGLPILSPEDGTVEEIRLSPYSYGKVFYFRGNSGKIWVFAHQSGFSKILDSLVSKEQKTKQKNDIRIYPNVSFKKGDTLSFSGSTGIGNPHLHLELREEKSRVLPPCLHHVACGDTLAPLLLGSAVWNDEELRLSGEKAFKNNCLETPSKKKNRFVSFKIADYSRTPLSNPMSIRRLKIDEILKAELPEKTSPLFEKIQDTLYYGDMLKIRKELLWAEEADTAGDWHFVPIALQEKTEALKIELEDYSGNTSHFVLSLQDECPKDSISKRLFQDSLLYTFLSRAYVSFSGCRENLKASLLDSKGNVLEKNLCEKFAGKDLPIEQLLKNPKVDHLIFGNDTIYLQKLKAKKTAVLNRELGIQFEINGLQKAEWPLAIAFRKRPSDSLLYIEMMPKGLHFTGDFKFCADENKPGKLFYLGETTRKWFYFSKQKISRGWLCASMNELRDIALISDSIPPALGEPYRAEAPIAGIFEPVLRIPILEAGSGIENGNAINVWVNGRWIASEYDSEPGELVLKMSELPEKGEYFVIHLKDEVGNAAAYPVKVP